jgi:transcriptional regulator with XRE-family HTH domain
MSSPADDDATDTMILGRALRALRDLREMPQEELAVRSGIGVTYVSQLENGHRGARWHTVRRLLRALDATIGDLAAEVERQERLPRQ